MEYANNPFRIPSNQTTMCLRGYAGETDGFCLFSSLHLGLRAFFVVFRRYCITNSCRGNVCLSEFMSYFYPKSLYPVSSYISSISDRMAVTSYFLLSVYEPIYLYKFMRALAAVLSNYSLNQFDFDYAYHHFLNSQFSSKDLFEL